MSNTLPQIDTSADFGDVHIDLEAVNSYLILEVMTPEQIGHLTITASPERHDFRRQVPAHIASAVLSDPVFGETRQKYDRLETCLFPNNITDAAAEDPRVVNRSVAEALSEAVDFATIGPEGIRLQRHRVLQETYRRAIIRPALGTAALAAAEVAAYRLNEHFDVQLPGALGIVGAAALLVAAYGTHVMGARARDKNAAERQAFQTWPDQINARKRAKDLEARIENGTAQPVATLQPKT